MQQGQEEKQIRNMIAFIEAEAQEKVTEIEQQAQEDYDIEKQKLVEADRAKIRADVEKKKRAIEIDRRVQRANHSKAQRMKVMEQRRQILENLQGQVKTKLQTLGSDSGKNKALLEGLMKQSALAITCDSQVQCRKADEKLVSGLLKTVEDFVAQRTQKKISLTVSKQSLSDEDIGGIRLTSLDGKIICDNTLATRLSHAFQEQLPAIRYKMFETA
jgi:V-type H+-transporting ATPase subunit E